VLDRVVDFLAGVAGVVLCALIALICVDVTARNFRLFPIPWSLEVAQYALYAMTYIAAPWVLKIGGHISVDLLVQNLPESRARTIGRFTSIAGGLVSAVLFYYSVRVIISFILQEQLVHGALIFPKWWVYIPAPVTFLLMFLIFLRWAIDPSRMLAASADKADGL
jgi:TRAP-type C4-dicarboxylate transport system permease small subunit